MDDDFFIKCIKHFYGHGNSSRLSSVTREQADNLIEGGKPTGMSTDVSLNVESYNSPFLLTFANSVQTNVNITLRVGINNYDIHDVSLVKGGITVKPLIYDVNSSVTATSVRELLRGRNVIANPVSNIFKLTIQSRITGTLDELAQIFVGTKIRRAEIRIPDDFTSRQVMNVLKKHYFYEDTDVDYRSIQTSDLSMFVVEHNPQLLYFSKDFPIFPDN